MMPKPKMGPAVGAFAMLASVVGLSCKEGVIGHEGRVNSVAAAETVAVMIGSAGQDSSLAQIILATDQAIQAIGLCAAASGSNEACSPSSTGFLAGAPAQNSQTGTDRNLFQVSTPITLDATKVYTVIDVRSLQILRKFRFKSAVQQQTINADPLTAGLSLLNEETLRKELTHFASDGFNGRLAGTPDNEKAAQYIVDQLKAHSIEPARPGQYLQPFKVTVGPAKGQTTSNIVAVLPGQHPTLKDEYIVIGAHMDHAGTLTRGYTCSAGAAGSNQICNGADDNGSGTVALLNAAKALGATRQSLHRTIILIWFSGEEEGLLGSYHYVRSDPIFPLAKTVYMVNIDMVGYMNTNGNNLAALGGGTSPTGAKILGEIGAKQTQRKIKVTAQAGGGSDHVPFMAKGIPGVFLHTGVSNNRNYHRTSDTPDKIDYSGMLMATQVTFELGLRASQDPGLSRSSFNLVDYRAPLVTEEEMAQSCHHLMKNPFIQEALDFTDSNSGRAH